MARYILLFFIGGWLLVTTFLAVLSGWFFLMRRYPDLREAPILKLGWQSGRMGLGVHMNGVLTLSACPSGLRVGMLRIFGVFCRDFFVPWEEVFVNRTESFWLMGPQAKLTFGSTGTLTVLAAVADQLALVVPGRWPEAQLPPPATRKDVFWRFARLWLIFTALASAFFTFASRLGGATGDVPPVAVTILFPAIALALSFLWQYWLVVRHLPKQGRSD